MRPKDAGRPMLECPDEEASSGDEAGCVDEDGVPLLADGSPDWSAWNRTQVRNVDRFRRTSPSGPLMITVISAKPLAGLTKAVIELHTDEYETKQRLGAATGDVFMTLGMALQKGDCFREFRHEIDRSFWDLTSWRALAPEFRTRKTKALAFGCLSRSLCGAEMMVIEDTKRLPHVLDELLLDPDGAAETIHRKPPCMWDDIMPEFSKRYDTVDKLKSIECRQEVFVKSWLGARAAVTLESRMAQIRSLVHQRQQTWKKSVADLFSEFLLLQNRPNEVACGVEPIAKKANVAPERKEQRRRKVGRKRKGEKTGGGGKRRSSLSHTLRCEWAKHREKYGKKKPTKDQKIQMLKVAHAQAAVEERNDPSRWVASGRAGTLSHQAGHRGFGGWRRFPRKRRGPPPLGGRRARQPALTSEASLSEIVDASSLVLVVSSQAERRKRKLRDMQEAGVSLARWRSTHGTASSLPDASSVAPGLETATLVPAGNQLPNFTVLKWCCPASGFASKIVAGLSTNEVQGDEPAETVNVGDFEHELCETWGRRCQGFQVRDCKTLTVAPRKPRICFIANRCLCSSAAGRNTMRFVRSATQCLTGTFLPKGTAGRALFTAARAVLRVFRKGKQHVLRAKDRWCHLGYGNFNTTVFFVLPLILGPTTVYAENVDTITLSADTRRPCHLWDFFPGR